MSAFDRDCAGVGLFDSSITKLCTQQREALIAEVCDLGAGKAWTEEVLQSERRDSRAQITALTSENEKLREALGKARDRLDDVSDLADRVVAEKDFGLNTKAERLDAIGEAANLALTELNDVLPRKAEPEDDDGNHTGCAWCGGEHDGPCPKLKPRKADHE